MTADAIAAARNTDNSTDLYAAANGGLYYFQSMNQKDGATGELVYSNTLLTGVRTLYAYATGGQITVWGLNANDQVFYLTCPQTQIASSAAWNHPLAIMKGVDAISPYVDRAYSTNTFFAHTGTGLVKMVKTPATGLWSQRSITLPPSKVMQNPASISSYTTHIKVTDQHGQMTPNVAVTLTATSVTSVYINHLYYIVGPTPIQIATDSLGTITIVEIAHTLAGTRFNAAVGQQATQPINPMDTAFQRNAKYTTADSLKNAKIVDSKGRTKPFLPSNVSAGDLTGVASANQSLAKAYAGVAGSPTPVKSTAPAKPATKPAAIKSGPPTMANLAAAGIGGAILVDIGDLFSTLAQGVEAVVTVFEDVANAVWHIIAAIGGAVYHAILDCVEAVVAAATWIYNQIKIAVQDVINFLQFLFGWDDILTTHLVMKNYLLQVAKYAINGLETTKAKVKPVFQQLETQIAAWTGIPNIEQMLNLSDSLSSTNSANPPMAGQNSAPSNLGVHHFQGNAGASTSSVNPADPAQAILQDLINLMKQEEAAISTAGTAIQTDIVDQFATLSLSEIIKRFIGIIGVTVVESAENVIEALLDILAQMVEGVIEVLTAPIDIPVLSYLYKQVSGEDLTFLDAVCLIAAIPATLIYKVAANAAPFPSDSAFTKGLIKANSFAEIQALFMQPQARGAAAGAAPAPVSNVESIDDLGSVENDADSSTAGSADPSTVSDSTAVLNEDALRTFGFTSGVFALIGSIPLIIANTFLRADTPPAFPKVMATLACVGNLAYVAPNYNNLINAATATDWASILNDTVTVISVVKGAALIGAAAYADNQPLQIAFATVETLINLLWNAPVINNAIANKDAVITTYKSLIPESVGNFAFNVGGILELPFTLGAKILEAPQYVLMGGYGVCMVIAGGIYRFAPNQSY